MPEVFKPKERYTLPASKRNKKILLTLETELYDFLNLVRPPNHSVQETMRQILRAYAGLDKKPTNPEIEDGLE